MVYCEIFGVPYIVELGLDPSIWRTTMKDDKIRVIVFQEGEAWIAQGLERDICVQASSLDDVYGRFEVAVRLECEDGSLDHIDAAPLHFQELWDKQSGKYQPKHIDLNKYDIALAA
jgi:hypothetical protein